MSILASSENQNKKWPHGWLVHSTLDQVVQVQALAGDNVLCSWAGPFTLTVPIYYPRK